MRVDRALPTVSTFHMLPEKMTYASEKVFLEVELDVRILLDYPEDLDCLLYDLIAACESLPVVLCGKLLPQVLHHHLRQWSQ